MGRKWGSSLSQAKQRRIEFARGKALERNADKAVRLDTEKKLVTQVIVRKRNFELQQMIAQKRGAVTVMNEAISSHLHNKGVLQCFSQLMLPI